MPAPPDPRVSVRIAADLREGIADGRYPPGSPAPSITVLSQEYGCARQTSAKALGVLAGEGLVKRWAGLGYYVTARPAA